MGMRGNASRDLVLADCFLPEIARLGERTGAGMDAPAPGVGCR